MKSLITLVAVLSFGIGSNCHESQQPATPSPSRTVSGQTLTSTALPAVRLELDKNFKYAGGHSFVLYDVANAEQHFFVDADKDGLIRRMYWIQFEGYLPSNAHSYNYKATKTINIGGLDFVADAYARNIKANPGRANSDGSRAREFLASKGFKLGSDDVMSQRLVHLVDEAKRNELMIIYLEDLSPMKLSAADLAPGGKNASEWEKISAELLDRAVKNIKVLR
jgi:hypothetical protein